MQYKKNDNKIYLSMDKNEYINASLLKSNNSTLSGKITLFS